MSRHLKQKVYSFNYLLLIFVITNIRFYLSAEITTSTNISGELKQWHKITLTFDGPETSELDTPNPFLDYRLLVTFNHEDQTFIVPGFFAADGIASQTSATSGNKWRVHFSPNRTGRWAYSVSFKQGNHIAISDSQGNTGGFMDGLQGHFDITESDKDSPDLRYHGRLNYVGEHYLQFASSGKYFIKQGPDSPENFLAYEDFDGDFKNDGVLLNNLQTNSDDLIKNWSPHIQDWNPGEPIWQGDKGKGIIGAINYLASKKMNSISFLTMNINGDDKNVFPYTTYDERFRMDCSKLDQWEIFFEHATNKGMYLHFKTQETENSTLLDGGALGPERKLYYRELIARFGHHLALNWNLGEEFDLDPELLKSYSQYFKGNDPYQHNIVVHTYPNQKDVIYPPLLGSASNLTGASLQTHKRNFKSVFNDVKKWVTESRLSGKKWVVACDEPGDAGHALVPDTIDPTHDRARKNALWGTLLAGGAGNEWYFGYENEHSDLTCQDFRSRDLWWDQCRYAIEFFYHNNIPVWQMENDNSLTNAEYCFFKENDTYVVFLRNGGPVYLDLNSFNESYIIKWFNPRKGGQLANGSIRSTQAGLGVNLGQAPYDLDQDWVILVKKNTEHEKFFGSVYKSDTDENVFLQYWNQITPENDGKWEYIEPQRDVMDWTVTDAASNFAKENGFPLKQHTFVWNWAVPTWVADLSPTEQKEEIEEWIRLFCERYPDVQFIDVVNEPINFSDPVFKEALGGDGESGWDWVIWSFEKARQYAPNAKLLINEFGMIAHEDSMNSYMELIQILINRSLIDGIGLQSHNLENVSKETIKAALDRVATLGLPIYISELDINIAGDNPQRKKYEEIFPVFWEHPSVHGVTLWGYQRFNMWRKKAYLIREDGSIRPALTWLSDYLENYIPNLPPLISFNNINENDSFRGSIDLIDVSSSDSDGTIESIRLFIDNSLVSEISEEPYRWTASSTPILSQLSVGRHTLRVVTTDNKGAQEEDHVAIVIEPQISPHPYELIESDWTESTPWKSVSLQQAYVNPIIIASPLLNNDTEAAHVRMRNVTSTGFEFQVEKWNYLTETSSANHLVQFLILEEGVHMIEGQLWEAGQVETDHNFQTFNLDPLFDGEQTILGQVVTTNESTPVVVRMNEVKLNSFQVKVEEEEAEDKVHVSETVNYIAIQNGSVDVDNLKFKAGKTDNKVKHTLSTIDFENTFHQPFFFAQIRTYDGRDTADLRIENINESSVTIFVEEETSRDLEVNHTSEVVNWIVLEKL